MQIVTQVLLYEPQSTVLLKKKADVDDGLGCTVRILLEDEGIMPNGIMPDGYQ